MGRIEGRVITCSVCGKAGHTLVKIGDNSYRHEQRAICDYHMTRRQAVLPSIKLLRRSYG